MIPPDQTVRDALANMVMEFRGMRDQCPDGWTVYPEEFGAWADRLERAVQKLDAERERDARMRCALEDIASGEMGINISIKVAQDALTEPSPASELP